MTLNLAGLITAAAAPAQTSGLFDRVQSTEQIPPGGKGLTLEVWLDTIRPVAERSGLAATSGRIALNVRVRVPIARDLPDNIDIDMAAAVDVLFAAYSGDFQLGGLAAQVDLLGAYGVPLSGKGGYLTQSGYRIFDITLPIIVNDLYPQSE